jgi:hypothetical protein
MWVKPREYSFLSKGENTHFEVLEKHGTLRVLRQPSPWSLTAGVRRAHQRCHGIDPLSLPDPVAAAEVGSHDLFGVKET